MRHRTTERAGRHTAKFWRRRAAASAAILAVLAAVVLLLSCRAGEPESAEKLSNTQAAVSSTTSTTLAPLPPHRLTLDTRPSNADVSIRLADGSTREVKTPYKKTLPGGKVTLTLSLKGYNQVQREVVLDKDRTVTVWLDPEGLLYQTLVRFNCGPNPKQVAFTPDGKELWVSLLGGHGVQVFEPKTGRLLQQVKLGKHGAVEVIFTSDGETVYASQMETATVWEINRKTREVVRTIKTKGVWTKVLLLSSDEKTLYAANWSSNDVSEINLASGEVRRLLKTVATPRGLYVTPDQKRLFVAGYENGEIERINLVDGSRKVLLRTGGAMRHMVGDSERGLLYADDMAVDQTYVVDLATEEVRKLAPTDEKPNTIDLSPDGKVLYVSCRGENGSSYYLPGPEWGSVVVIDTETGKILDAIMGGNQPTGLDVSPDGKLLAFSDFLDDRIRILEIPSYQTLASGGGGRAQTHLADIPKK